MPQRREFPADPSSTLLGRTHRRPITPLQALMEAPPGADPESSVLEGLPLRWVLDEAIDGLLTPREKWVFEALVIRRESHRNLARELAISKTHVGRIRDAAVQKLQAHLSDHPLVKEYLHA